MSRRLIIMQCYGNQLKASDAGSPEEMLKIAAECRQPHDDLRLSDTYMIHTCMHVYIHTFCTYIHTCIHTYYTYIHAHTRRHACVRTYVRAYVRTYVRTYINTFIYCKPRGFYGTTV